VAPCSPGRLKRALHWLLLAVALLFLLSGLGITEYRIVTAATFGLLGKAASQKLHDLLWIPFTALLLLHVLVTALERRRRRRGST
jgi:cytochrome b subunit of formate dehydrogenase